MRHKVGELQTALLLDASIAPMHEVIDVFSVIVAILGLVALWIEPQKKSKRRRYMAVSLTCLIVVGIGFLLWQRHLDARESYQKAVEDARIEASESKSLSDGAQQVLRRVCESGPQNYEAIYSVLTDYENGLAGKVIDELTDVEKVLEVQHISVKNLQTGQTFSIRVWALRQREKGRCDNI